MTNPDNVGWLPEFVAVGEFVGYGRVTGEPHVRMSSGLRPGVRLFTEDQMRAYGELCRAAPAGSGEVEEYDWDAAHEALESIDDYARMDVGVAPHGPYTVLRDLLTKAKGWQEAAALLRKLQQGADGWRPIETAPKDGTRVLLCCMSPTEYSRRNTGYMAVCGYDEGWGEFNRAYFPATHWQPLPEPPAYQGQEG